MNKTSWHRYLEMVGSKHNRSAFMAEVGASRACEHRKLWRWRGGRRHEGHGALTTGHVGRGRACRGSGAGSTRGSARRTRCCTHHTWYPHSTSTCLPRWSCLNTTSKLTFNISTSQSKIPHSSLRPFSSLTHYLGHSNKG